MESRQRLISKEALYTGIIIDKSIIRQYFKKTIFILTLIKKHGTLFAFQELASVKRQETAKLDLGVTVLEI